MARILVVDDSSFTRNLLDRICTQAGHDVVGHAASAEKAIELYKELKPDLVLLDYLMPGRSGGAALDQIIADDEAARIIMISGSGDSTIEEKALAAGARAFLEKPFDGNTILTAIGKVMAQ